jgi:crotonobetaine/carnitine-CoA ligase
VVDIGPTDIAAIFYTSGTTGPSKGVIVRQARILETPRHTAWLLDYTREDVLYSVYPLFHGNAKSSILSAMQAGSYAILDQRFSASRFWEICRSRGITEFNYMGTVLAILWKQPPGPRDRDHKVRVMLGGGCPPDLIEPFEERFGCQLIETFGMTEASTPTCNRPDARRIGSIGRETASFEVRIFDEEDNEVPRGTVGEIVLRPKKPHIMFAGYYKMPEVTVTAWRNLWFHTGDRGRMDDDGFIYYSERAKDSIRRRGENISSWEVEQVIDEHEKVVESAVFAVNSDLAEDEVMVAVVTQPGTTLTAEELLDHCQDRMAYFAIPRFVRFVDELPKTPTLRVQKYKLREAGVTEDTWDRETHGYLVRR